MRTAVRRGTTPCQEYASAGTSPRVVFQGTAWRPTGKGACAHHGGAAKYGLTLPHCRRVAVGEKPVAARTTGRGSGRGWGTRGGGGPGRGSRPSGGGSRRTKMTPPAVRTGPRARELLGTAGTARAHQGRGLLLAYGLVLAPGMHRLRRTRPAVRVAAETLPTLGCAVGEEVRERGGEGGPPGGEGPALAHGRPFAAGVGVGPRPPSTGGKTILGRSTQPGNVD